MSPRLLATLAADRGLEVVALTDHNSALNAPAFAVAAARAGIIPLFGMELTSREEAHILAVFPDPRRALEFGAEIGGLRPHFAWSSGPFGDQIVVDADEGVIEEVEEYLNVALDADFSKLAELARAGGGMAIPAHVDRDMFSVSSQLGYLPEGEYDAVEAVGEVDFSLSRGLAVIHGSDAHYPDGIGRRFSQVDAPREAAARLRAALCRFAREGCGDIAAYPEKEAQEFFDSLRLSLTRPSAARAK